jgi:phage-related protein
MGQWILEQYNNVVDLFLDNCSQGLREVLERRLDILSEKGNQCRGPITKYLGDGLFELRGKADSKQARLVFFFSSNRKICFVHAFFKKTEKTNRNDIELSKKNKKIIEAGKGKINGFNYIH